MQQRNVTCADGSVMDRQEHGYFGRGNTKRQIIMDTLSDFVLTHSAAVFAHGPTLLHVHIPIFVRTIVIQPEIIFTGDVARWLT